MTAPGRPRAIVSEESTEELEYEQDVKEPTTRQSESKTDSITRSLSSSDGNNTRTK